MDHLSLVGIVPWEFVAQIANLLIQAALFKKFLFKPVQGIIAKRRGEVNAIYGEAEAARTAAEEEKAEYDRQNPLISAEITSAEIDGWVYGRYEYNLTNHSDRVLRKTEIVILIFDENGAPIDSINGAWDIEDENGKEVVNAETDLEFWGGVQPGETKECYGYADGDAVKYKICVRSAEFEDGETWENPYFKVWLSEEKDRY